MSITWTEKPLAKMVTVTAGQGAPQDAADFGGTGHPFIRAGSLDSLLKGLPEADCETLSDASASKNGMRLFPRDTIVFAKSGMSAKLGRVYRLRDAAYLTSHLAALVPDGRADPGYLHRWLTKNPPSHLIPNDSYPSIRLSDIERLSVPTPCEADEQRRIAAILDKADGIRARRRAVLALTDDLLRAAFLDLFGDPVANPQGWPKLPLGNLGKLERGRSMHRPRNDPKLYGGIYPFIQTGDVARAKDVIKSWSVNYSDFGLKQSRLWPAGTLCITIAANIADTAVLGFDACFPDSVVGFVPSDDATSEYIQHVFRLLRAQIAKDAPVSAQANINLDILRNLIVCVPPRALQRKFSDLVARSRETSIRFRSALAEADTLYAALADRAFNEEL
ncbi:restriction endonuclease subunit S [Glacieibacterium frigidum]|uniref:Restriction endonuclease subunit S n=1 Tax=Glacieibacterium frigidum TaxID=2593303 RepID=A0A552UA95_9SPHN|nr:restriction endonuclease subunit S [Glacieibacterium frigidum]TRW15138.1 restriction endonuclease subunit S [Glacieibacterium frigidum]